MRPADGRSRGLIAKPTIDTLVGVEQLQGVHAPALAKRRAGSRLIGVNASGRVDQVLSSAAYGGRLLLVVQQSASTLSLPAPGPSPRINFYRNGEDGTRMTDALGWRAKFGVLAPSTNTIVEPDFYRMSVPGVTAHFSRIHIRDQNLGSDAAFEALLEQVREETGHAVARVLTAEPDYMIMGMSSETFWGGVEGNRHFIQQIKACRFSGISRNAQLL